MQGSKIRLSPAEAALFSDAKVILTKNSIIQKTVSLLGEIQLQMMHESPDSLKTLSPSPKISKGENYLGLPYVILDYPRVSNNEGLFFIRSMFWWGNFYSSTLQLSGSFKESYTRQISGAFESLKDKNYFIGVNADPWVHHFGEDNYKNLDSLSTEAFTLILEEQAHIKIAAFWPLNKWDPAANNLLESWKFLLKLVS